ncbi:MAG TPA: hypothetical protein PLR99_08400 [Polyangiaceae bacterium]|nr:hypothetical protein [Polyangiaceae bacterium]
MKSSLFSCAGALVVVLAAACSGTTTTADGGAGDGGTSPTADGATPPTDGATPPTDGAVPPTDGGGGGACATLRNSGQPYVCFTISGGGLTTTYDVAYPRVPPAAFQVYFGLTAARSFFRMNGLPKVNGADERVAIDFTVAGTAPVTEAWRTDIGGGGSGPKIIFFGPDIGSGDTAERREFGPIDGSTDLGTTTITRFGAVGEMVEGTFSGIGNLDQRLPTPQIFERVNLSGSFRVLRAPDA